MSRAAQAGDNCVLSGGGGGVRKGTEEEGQVELL